MYVNVPHSLISASWWCLDKCNSRLPFAIQTLTVIIQTSMKMHAEPRACYGMAWICKD